MTCLFWPIRCGGQKQTRSETHADAGAGGGTESGKHGYRLLRNRRSTRLCERAERCRRKLKQVGTQQAKKGRPRGRRFGSSASSHQLECVSQNHSQAGLDAARRNGRECQVGGRVAAGSACVRKTFRRPPQTGS